MANNIGTTNTFNTSNMKPEADEEIPAIWGQNMADNLGYLYYGKNLQHFRFQNPSYVTTSTYARGTDWGGSGEQSSTFDLIPMNGYYNHVQRDIVVRGTAVIELGVTSNQTPRSFACDYDVIFAGGTISSGTTLSFNNSGGGTHVMTFDGTVSNIPVGEQHFYFQMSGTTNIGGAAVNDAQQYGTLVKLDNFNFIPLELL